MLRVAATQFGSTRTTLPSESRGWKSRVTRCPASTQPVSQPRRPATVCAAAACPTCKVNQHRFTYPDLTHHCALGPCGARRGASRSQKWDCTRSQRTVTSMLKGEPGSVSPSSVPTTVSWCFPAFVALYLGDPGAVSRQIVGQQPHGSQYPTWIARLDSGSSVCGAMATACHHWLHMCLHSAPNLAGAVTAVVYS